mmetsp:Transcript_740/g.1595  ORF Transcript_740/g.1595 Transcript_740/m.1595 type:complete len:101 (+) Transcript_740:115-417(+)
MGCNGSTKKSFTNFPFTSVQRGPTEVLDGSERGAAMEELRRDDEATDVGNQRGVAADNKTPGTRKTTVLFIRVKRAVRSISSFTHARVALLWMTPSKTVT